MSASIITNPMTVSQDTQPSSTKLAGINECETESAECDCCGLAEEYTKSYIKRVRERHNGAWICGLCSEAIKDEIVRSERLISTEEALKLHMSFCKSFKSSGPPPNPAVHLIAAMRQILLRSLDSPRAVKSLPSSPTRGPIQLKSLIRSESCFLPIVDDDDLDRDCKLES